MRFFGSHNHEELRCPYKGCEKAFDKPTVFTDSTCIPRQTYYACPHCMSKIDVLTDNMKIVGIKPVEYPATVFDSPAKCAHYSGLLGAAGISGYMPDECLMCPKVLQCQQRTK